MPSQNAVMLKEKLEAAKLHSRSASDPSTVDFKAIAGFNQLITDISDFTETGTADFVDIEELKQKMTDATDVLLTWYQHDAEWSEAENRAVEEMSSQLSEEAIQKISNALDTFIQSNLNPERKKPLGSTLSYVTYPLTLIYSAVVGIAAYFSIRGNSASSNPKATLDTATHALQNRTQPEPEPNDLKEISDDVTESLSTLSIEESEIGDKDEDEIDEATPETPLTTEKPLENSATVTATQINKEKFAQQKTSYNELSTKSVTLAEKQLAEPPKTPVTQPIEPSVSNSTPISSTRNIDKKLFKDQFLEELTAKNIKHPDEWKSVVQSDKDDKEHTIQQHDKQGNHMPEHDITVSNKTVSARVSVRAPAANIKYLAETMFCAFIANGGNPANIDFDAIEHEAMKEQFKIIVDQHLQANQMHTLD